MFKRIRRFFGWRSNLRLMKEEIEHLSRRIEYFAYQQEKINNTIGAMEKKSHDDYVNLHDIRNMVGRISADLSSMSLEMAMKPSMGEQPFVKVSVPMSDYVMEGDL